MNAGVTGIQCTLATSDYLLVWTGMSFMSPVETEPLDSQQYYTESKQEASLCILHYTVRAARVISDVSLGNRTQGFSPVSKDVP